MLNQIYRKALKNGTAMERVKAELDLILNQCKNKKVLSEKEKNREKIAKTHSLNHFWYLRNEVSDTQNRIECLGADPTSGIARFGEPSYIIFPWHEWKSRTLTYDKFLQYLKQVIKADLLKDNLGNPLRTELKKY